MLNTAQRRLLLLTATFALSLLSCGREVTGPENGVNYGRSRFGAISLDPQMPSLLASLVGASEAVPFTKVRVVLRREDGTIAIDTLVDFPANAEEVSLSLIVPLPLNTPEAGLPLALTMAYVNTAGDTVFRGGPTNIVAPPVGSGAAQQPIVIPITYDGVGKDAARVAIAPKSSTQVAGTTSIFTAQAFDNQNAPIANTPVVYYTLDSTRASVPNAGSGAVTWLPNRGTARIVAALPNGLKADTALVLVSLPASQLVIQSGNTQSAIASGPLAQPIILRTLASDNVPVAGVTVNFAVATGGGILSALVDTSDANGEIATSWTLGAPVGGQSITATSAGLTGSPATITAIATAGTPTQVVFTQLPTSGTAGVALTPAVVVAIHDVAGNLVTTFSGPVGLALPIGANGSITGTSTVNAVAGLATFSGISFDLVGAYQLIATQGTLVPDTSTAINIIAGAGARLEFLAQPLGAIAGVSLVPPVTVVARDSKGNLAASFTGTVAVALLNPSGATLGGTLSVAAVAGVATFSTLTVDKVASNHSLAATSGALVADTSAQFGISPSIPTVIVPIAGDAQTGPASQVLSTALVVEVRDAFGNVTPGVTVNFNNVVGGGSASSPSVVTNALGRATMNWTLGPLVGGQVFRALLPAFSATYDFTATATIGAPSQLAFIDVPTVPQVAGQALSPTVVVQVRDAGGNVVTNYNGLVTLGLGTNPTGAPLLGTLTVNAVSGVATFSGLSLEKAGVGYTLQASADVLPVITSSAFDVVPTTASAIVPVAGDAQTALVGAALTDSIAVRVTDAFGNKIAGVSVTVAITSGGGTVIPSVLTTNVLGEARTAWTLGATAGVQSITATIPGGANVVFTALATAGAATGLTIVSGNTQTVEVGTQAAPIVFAVTDIFGNPIAGATVNFTVLTGAGSLVSASGITNALGQASALWTMGIVAGAQSIQADVGGGITVNATASAVAGAAAQFQFFFPTGDNVRIGVAGTPMNDTMYVRVRDQYGNPKIGHPTNWAVLPGFSAVAAATVLTDAGGLARNTATFGTTRGTNFGAGVTTDGLGSTLLYEAQVSAAGATSFAFTSQPAGPVLAGAAIGGAVVGARDVFSNLGASFDSVTIVVDSGPAGAVLLGTTSFAGVSGSAAITGLSLDRVGTYRLRAQRGAITAAVSAQLVVTAGAGANLTLVSGGAQTGVVAAALASPVVYRVTDAFGNLVPGVIVSWNNPPGSGSTSVPSSVTNAAGETSVTWTLGNAVGVMSLGAVIDGGVQASTSATATVGAASNFVIFSGNSQTGAAGTAFSDTLRVRVTDTFGNPIAGATTNWTPLAGASSLTSPTANTDANGVAFNTGVFATSLGALNAGSVTTPGIGSTLVFAVTITAGAAQTLEFTGPPAGGIAGGVIAGIVIAARDAFNNAGAAFDSVAIVVDSGPAGAVLSGTTTRAAVAGSASFNDLTLDLAGTYKLRAERGGITAGVSTSFVITAGTASTLSLDSGDNQSAPAGGAFALPVRVRVSDAFGNAVAGAQVAWSGINVSVASDTTLSDAAGFAQVNTTAGGLVTLGTVTATLVVVPTEFVVFDAAITAGAATTLVVDTQPLDGTAGTLLSGFAFRVNDAFGNLATSFSGPVRLSAQLINGTPVNVIAQEDSVDAVGGLAAFTSVRIDVAGTYRLVANFGALGTVVTDSIVVGPDAPANIALVDGDAQTGAVTGTLALPLRVRVTDTHGNSVPGVSVNWGVQSGSAAFTDTVVVSDVSGFAQTTVLLAGTAGDISIGAFAAGLSGSPVIFTATAAAGAVTELVLVSGGSQNVVAGTPASAATVVRARDAFGNPVSGVSVTFNVLDGASAFSDTTVVTDAAGLASTTATGATATGSRSFEAAAIGVTSLSIPIEILAAAPQSFEVTESGPTETAGTTLGVVTVRARDAFGNIAAYADSVALSIDSGPIGGTLFGTTTVLAAGTALFSDLQLQIAGSYVLRADWPGVTSGLSGSIVISPAAPFAIAATFGDGQSGAVQTVLADSLRVRVTDTFGNGVSGVTVNWGTQFGDATPTVASSVSDANGFAATTVSLGTTVGAAFIEAAASGLTGSPVGFNLTVTAGAATQLVVDAQPTTGTAGVTLGGVAVSARDALGNVVTVFADNISVAVDSAPVSGVLLGTLAVAPSGGIATFNDLSVESAGSYRLRFTALGVPDTLSAVIVVAPSVPSAIALVSGNTQSDTVGLVLGTPLRVRVTDIFGNPIAGQPVAWAPVGAGAVGQDTTFTDASGAAQVGFTLGTTAGSTTAEASVDGITGSPVVFTMTAIPSAVDTIVVTQQPTTTASAAVGAPINAELRDVYGNVVTWFIANVQLFVQTGPGGLGLARTRAAVAGTVSFDDLTLNLAGSYTLRLAAVGAPDVLTDTLVIVAGAPASVVMVSGDAQSGIVTLPLPLPLQVRVTDANSNPIVGDTVVFSVTQGGGALSSATALDSAITNSSGIAQTTWTLGSDSTITHIVQANRTGFATLSFTATPLPFVANRTWTGDVDSNLLNSGNWKDGLIPAVTDSVLVPAGRPNYPVLTSNIQTARVTVASGASVELGPWLLFVDGSMSVLGSGTITSSDTGAVALQGAGGGTVRGAFPRLVVSQGNYSAIGSISTATDLQVIGNGILDLGGTTTNVARDLAVTGAARLVMTSGSTLVVEQNATFNSTNTTTGLDNGTLRVRGNVSANSFFRPSPSHITDLDGAGTQTVQFTLPDSSFTTSCNAGCFGTLVSNKASGGLIFLSSAKAIGGMTFTGDTLGAAGRMIIGIDSLHLQSLVTTVGHAGYTTSLQIGSVFIADTLVAFGGDGTTPLATFGTITSLVPGSYRLGTNHPGAVIVTGQLDIDGPNARIGGNLITAGAGHIRMTDAGDSLSVAGAQFGGTTDSTFLTAGVLEVRDTFSQPSLGTTFAAQAAHRLRFTAANPSIVLTAPELNPVGSLFVTDGSALVVDGSGMRVGGTVVLEGTTATATAATAEVTVLGGIQDAVGGRWFAASTRFEGDNVTQIPSVMGGAVVFAGAFTLADSLISTGGGVRVTTPGGVLTLAGHKLSSFGFSTDDGGRLVQTVAADTLLSYGSVDFAGGANTLLDGYIGSQGNLTQTAPATFQPAAPHHVQIGIVPGVGGRILRLTPGNAFAKLTLTASGIVDLQSDIDVDVLDIPSGAQVSTTVASVLRAGRLTGTSLSLDNVRLELTDAVPATIPSIAFGVMDPAVTQLSVSGNGGVLSFPALSFATTPTSGLYIYAQDNVTADNDTLTVDASGASPAFHGGKILPFTGSKIINWDAFAAINWTNGALDQNWFNSGNWAQGVIPGTADSVVIGETGLPPIIGGSPVQVRALVSSNGQAISTNDTLTVTRRLAVSSVGGLACTAGGALVLRSSTDSVTVQGNVDCLVIARENTVRLTNLTLVDSLSIENSGSVSVDQSTLNVAGELRTIGTGGLLMDQPSGYVEIGGTASFLSDAPDGWLTNGTLSLRGDFIQVGNPTAFRASGAHTTLFAGGSDQAVFFTNPDSSAAGSHFANVEIANNEGGISVALASDVFMNGELRASSGLQRTFSNAVVGGATIVSRGAIVSADLNLDGVRWKMREGSGLTGTLSNVRFTNQPEGITQLSIARDGGSIQLSGFQFDSLLASTTYLEVLDSFAGGGTFTVDMLSPSPAFHGGRINIDVNALLTNWSQEPAFIWTGALDATWTTPGNWSDNVVPNATSVVTIPDVGTSPATVSAVTVRQLVLTGNLTGLQLGDTLFVREGLQTQAAAVSCVALGRVRFVPTDTALVAGNINCPVDVMSGVMAQSGNTNLSGALRADSVGRVAVREFDLFLAPGSSFNTAASGTLSIDDAAGSLTVNGPATFAGGATTGLLTAGQLVFGGDVTQGGGDPAALDASSTLSTIFSGASGTVSIVDPASSGFGTSDVVAGTFTVTGTAPFRATLNIGVGGTLNGTGRIDVTGDISGDGGLVVSTAALTGSFLRNGPSQPDSVIFIGTGQTINSTFAANPIAWNTVIVEGTATAATSGAANDVLNLAQSLIVRGSGARLTFDNTGTPGDSLIANINNQIRTLDGGTVEMNESGVSVRVGGFSEFAGGDQNGLLTQGRLILEAGLRDTLFNAFAATGAHLTVIGGCGICDGIPVQNTEDASLRFASVRFVNGASSTIGASFLADTAAFDGGVVSMTGLGKSMLVNGDLTGLGSSTLNATRIAIGGVFGFNGTFNIDTLAMTGINQRLPAKDGDGDEIPYQNIDITGTVQTLMADGDSLTVSGGLRIASTGNLRFGESGVTSIVHLQSLGTSESGTIEIQDQPTTVRVMGVAVFGGGSTAGKLDAGTLEFHNVFSQNGGTSSSAFSAGGTNFTRIVMGAVAPVITFATPGPSGTDSHFNHLWLVPGLGTIVDLATDVYVNAQLTQNTLTPIEIRANGAPYRTLVSDGASLSLATFRGVNWEITSTTALASPLGDISFVDQDPAAVQFAIRRTGTDGTIELVNPTFSTPPTTGKYLEVEDLVLDANILTVNVTNATPGFHSGFAVTIGGAILTGWSTNGPGIWLGTLTNDFNTAGNWQANAIPEPTDSIFISDGASQTLTITSPITVGAIHVSGGQLDLQDTLTVTGTAALGAGSTFCSLGGALRVAYSGADSVAFSMNSAQCNVYVSDGRVYLDQDANLVNLFLEQDAIFDVNGQTLRTVGDLIALQTSVLVMTDNADTVRVGSQGRFQGGDETGLLTAGALIVEGTFLQGGATTAFASSGTLHVFLGDSTNVGPTQFQIDFNDPVTSPINRLTIFDNRLAFGPVQVTGELRMANGSALTGLATTALGGFRLAGSAALTVDRLAVAGPLFLAGTFTPDTVDFLGAGPLLQEIPAANQTESQIIYGTIRVLADSARMRGSVTYQITNGIEVGGNALLVVGNALLPNNPVTVAADAADLVVQGAGRLQQLSEGQLRVKSATFNGGDHTGLLTRGDLVVHNNFTQLQNGAVTTTFLGSEQHRVIIDGTSTVAIANPADARFADLVIDLDAVLTLTSDLFVDSSFTKAGTATSELVVESDVLNTDPPRLITVRGGTAFASGSGFRTVFRNVALRLEGDANAGGGSVSLADMTFQDMNPAATYIDVQLANYFIIAEGMDFATAVTTGKYFDIVDPTTTIAFQTSTPVLGCIGAVENCVGPRYEPAPPEANTWLGLTNDWTQASNWSLGTVPSTWTDVIVPVTSSDPVLGLNETVRNLTVETGATLTVLGSTINVNGTSLDVQGTIAQGGSSVVAMHPPGAPATISGGGTFGTDLTIGSPSAGSETTVTLTDSLRVAANLNITANTLVLGGQDASIGDLLINTTGRLQMSDAADSLHAFNVNFFGESTAGLLTAGKLVVLGDFWQGGTSPASFAASGSHQTIVSGVNSRTYTFANPGPTDSHFGTLRVEDFVYGDTLRLASDIQVNGQLQTVGNRLIASDALATTNRHISTLGFSNAGGNSNFGNVRLSTQALAGINLSANMFFGFMDSSVTQLSIEAPGGTVTIGAVTFDGLNGGDLGKFLSVTDNLVDGDSLRVNIPFRSPEGHGGFIQTAGEGLILGWDGFALYTFTGANSTVFGDSANWDVLAVPTSISNVLVANNGAFPLVINSPVTVKRLTTAVNSVLAVQDTVFTTGVQGGFDLVSGGKTCSGNGIFVVNDPSAGPTWLRADIPGCDLIVRQGNVNLGNGILPAADTTNVRDLRLEGGVFQTEGAVRVGGDFSMTGSSMLNLLDAGDSLIVQGTASFRGSQAWLTNGNLFVHGNLVVGAANPLQFRMDDSSHLALGNPNQSGGTHNITIDPGSQMHVDSLTIYDGSTTVTGQLNVRRRLRQLTSSTNILNGSTIVLGSKTDGIAGTLTTNQGSLLSVDRFELFGNISSAGDFSPDTADFVGTVPTDSGGIQRIRAANIADSIYQYKLVRVFENAVMNQIPTGIPIAYTIATGLQVLGGQLTIGNAIDTAYVNMANADLIVSGPLAGLNMTGLSRITADSSHFQSGFTSLLNSGLLRTRSLVQQNLNLQTTTLTAADPHVLDLLGTGTVWFENWAFNWLNDVRIQGNAVTTLASELQINGTLGRVANNDGIVTLQAANPPGFVRYVYAASTNFGEGNSGVVLNNVPLVLQGVFPGNSHALNNLTFQGMDPLATFLIANFSGQYSATFNNISFNSPVGISGRFFDFQAGDAGSVITFVNATPAAGCLASLCVPTDFSPAIEAPASWEGDVSSAWTDPGNWSTNAVPNAATIVGIPSGTPFSPFIGANTGVKSLGVNVGATLTVDVGITLSVYDELSVDGFVSAGSLTSTIRIVPPVDTFSLRAPGNIQTRLAIGSGIGGYDGVVQLIDRVNLTAANFNSGVYLDAGLLDLNGQTLDVAGSFRSFGTSRWQMVNPLDTLIVRENFDIEGGSTDGLLTEGEIDLSGWLFRQKSTNSQKSFVSTGNHSVRFSGGGNGMDVVFESPDSTLSRIANLAIDRVFDQWILFDYSRVFVTNLTKVSGRIEVYNDGFGVNLGSDGELIVSGAVSNVDPAHMFDMVLIGKVRLLGVNQATCDLLTFNVQYKIANFEPLSCHSSVYAWATETGTAAVTSYAAYAASDNDIWVVGANGTIQRGNGSSWTTETSNTDSTLFAVHGTSTTDVWAVGVSGTVAHSDGSSWTSSTQGAQNLNGVFAANINLAYAVGDNGTILRWDGISWSSMASGTSVNLRGIFGAGLIADDILAVGDNGTMLRLVSGSWVPITSVVTDNFKATYASTPSGYMVFGENGTIRQRSNPFNQFFDAGSLTTENLNGAGGNGTAGFTVGANGTILRILGESFLPQNALTSVELYGVTVTPSGTAYVVGAGGFITKGTIVP